MRFSLKERSKLIKIKEEYKLLSTSWNVQTALFFEHSTLHGVRYIAEKGRPFIERFMWFVCVSVGAVATLIIIVSLWEKFQTNPTITGLDTDFHGWDVPFPAVTVCQNFPSNASMVEEVIRRKFPSVDDKRNLSRFLMKLSQFSYKTLPELTKYFEKSFLPKDIDLKELAFELMNTCESIFTRCTFKSETYDCCDGFFPIFTENGFCYSFNSRHYEKKLPRRNEFLPPFEMKYIKETDIKWSLKFGISNDNEDLQVAIYIHNSDEVPTIDVKPQHVWDFTVDRISFSVKQTYTTEDVRQLSIKQRRCTFEDEIKLTIDHMYTYSACTRQCRMQMALKKCKCVPHFYPQVGGKYRHCSVEELACVVENLDVITSVDHCSCELGCSNTVYEIEKLNESLHSDTLEAEFVSWPMVRYKREILFGWVDLLVSFGGIAGLFLGFSLLSGVELIYYFTIRTCCMVHMERTKLKRIESSEKRKPKPKYDLSLTPHFKNKNSELIKTITKGFYQENLHKHTVVKISPGDFTKKSGEFGSPFGIEFTN